METNLRVLIADEDGDALEVLRATLDRLGHEVMPFAVSVSEAAELISREDPNLTIVMVHQDDEHALSLISEAVEFASGPVIATVRDGDADFLARAAEYGIAAYVQGTEPEAVQGAIEVSLRRYRDPPGGRQGGAARGCAAAPHRDRARQGDPHGAPRGR